MTRAQWKAAFNSMPPNLTAREIAKRLRKPYGTVRQWMWKLGYAASPARTMQWRRMFQRVPWAMVYWWQSNSEIARIWGVSREIVRRRRKEYANGR